MICKNKYCATNTRKVNGSYCKSCKEHIILRSEIDKLRDMLFKLQDEAKAMAHVILINGISPKELDECGCEECKIVKKGMKEAGYYVGESFVSSIRKTSCK